MWEHAVERDEIDIMQVVVEEEEREEEEENMSK